MDDLQEFLKISNNFGKNLGKFRKIGENIKKLSKVDKHDAPEGFVAVESYEGCLNCYFQGIHPCPRNKHAELNGISENRIDKCNVVFIQNEELETNTTNFEYFNGERWSPADNNQVREQHEHGMWVRNYMDFTNNTVVVRCFHTIYAIDVETIKKSVDKTRHESSYEPINDWFFVKV